MLHPNTPLNIAVRVYPEISGDRKDTTRRTRNRWSTPEAMFVFDSECRTDARQTLTFGSYRFFVAGRCLEEGIFYENELPAHERAVLEHYVESHPAETVEEGRATLRLIPVSEFVDRIYRAAFEGRCLLVGFNLPFDLSRVACDFTNARGRFAGGFALELWSYTAESGSQHHNPHRPRVAIKHIDSKRSLMGFTGCHNPDAVDKIPEGSVSGEPEADFNFRGHFLDLRTLAFALTDRSCSLETACKAFGVEHGKQHADRHGEIYPEYIDYNRRDVLATSELAVKLIEEYERHPITLQATKAYSPASVGKAYLRAMGIRPILERQPDFPKEYLGYAETAFFGGRTSAHIRKTPVPVIYTDFISMYPTVNSLMGLWSFVIAKSIHIVEHCENDIRTFVSAFACGKIQDLFNPSTWTHLTGFVKVIPEGDILPSRAKYSGGDWQVGLNHLYAKDGNPTHALWFSLPDVIASVILTGRIPNIINAFRITADGTSPGLKPIRLRGTIEVDPRDRDFFKVAIEERKRLKSRDIPDSEKDRLDKALKVLANSTSYGIYAEMNRQETDQPVDVLCHGIDPEPFKCRVAHPDVPGEYCFPPFAALITGAARLMLALLERYVTDPSLGGTYAMEDTDSMAIVANQPGGAIECSGGPREIGDDKQGVTALSWEQVDEIVERFAALNPYDRDAVPGSILKVEDENHEDGQPKSGRRRQIHCYAISAKRYALFLRDDAGNPVLLQKGKNNEKDGWKQHGLGHLLNPTDPDSEDRAWVGQVWYDLISRPDEIVGPRLMFGDRPAVGRISISSPAVMRPLSVMNDGKQYADKLKPFNFILTSHVDVAGHPDGTDPKRFHLIAPFESDPRRWHKMKWINQYSGESYYISTVMQYGSRAAARVKTYLDVAREYEFHPEAKCADSEGNVCDKQTVGLLQRRHVYIDLVKYIGKEANALEEVEAGLVHSEEAVYTEYPDPARDEWTVKVIPALKQVPLPELLAKSGMRRSALFEALAGRSRPHPRNQKRLAEIVRELGLI
jgi:hypothetical protein